MMLGHTADWHSHLASAHKVTEWHTKAPSSEPPAATAHLSKSAWMGNHNMGSGLEYHAPDPETRVHTVLPDAQPELKCPANEQTSCHCDAWRGHNKKRKKKLKSQSGFVLSLGRHSVGVGKRKRTHTHTHYICPVSRSSFFVRVLDHRNFRSKTRSGGRPPATKFGREV